MSVNTPIDPRSLGQVAVLMGGESAERAVSLMSGQGVLDALVRSGVNAHAVDPAQGGLWTLREKGFDRAFICLHGRLGEDGSVQGALEWMRIPYTGSGVMASAIAMDKVMTKRLWVAEGLNTPPHVRLMPGESSPADWQRVIDTVGLPLMVKPPREGSSIGASKVTRADDLPVAVAVARQHDDEVLCEAFIEGPELTCAVLGAGETATALPVIRIAAPQGAYDYQNKYFTDDVVYHCPSGLSPALEAQVQAMTVAAFQSLGCRGWGRADLMLRERDQQVFLLEMNTSPGMTSHSLVPMSARARGISYEQLCLHVLAQARLDHAAAGAA